MMTTETEQTDRAALAERVHGVERTCACCGARRMCRTVKVTADRVRGTGEHVWGICDDCHPAAGDLGAIVVRDRLGLEPDDDFLGRLSTEVPMFCDVDAHAPDRPNSSPWAHVDTNTLATAAVRYRRARERRHGGPCKFCGMDMTPAGTGWTLDTCGACQAEFGGLPLANSRGNRDHAAAVIVGLRHGSTTMHPLNLGTQLGLTWWSESGRRKANRTPFEHLDIAAMRSKANTMLLDREAWWHPLELTSVTWGLR